MSSDPADCRIAHIAVGARHTMALTDTGEIYAWGEDLGGQIGDGTQDNHPTPVKVVGLDGITITSISAGARHSLALSDKGEVYAWGDGDRYQLGSGNPVASPLPKKVNLPTRQPVTAISGGGFHCLAVTDHGELFSWGGGSNGQLGTGSGRDGKIPARVKTLDDIPIASVSAGIYHSLALTPDGHVYSWGWNIGGALGHGKLSGEQYLPTLIESLSNITTIAAGSFYSLALDSNETLHSWGSAGSEAQRGHLFIETTNNQPEPVLVREYQKVSAIAAGDQSFIITDDNHIYAAGGNQSGQLGVGDTDAHSTPAQVTLPENARATAVATNFAHTAFLTADGEVFMAGYGPRLGLGSEESRPTPVRLRIRPTLAPA